MKKEEAAILRQQKPRQVSRMLKCPSVNEWIKKLWYIYTMEYYGVGRKKELLPFETAWMDLESIMLSEIS